MLCVHAARMGDVALDIVLVTPRSDRAFGRGGRRIKHAMPMLGLACINGVLRSKGHRTRLIDLAVGVTDENDLLDCVLTEHPRFVGITAVTAQIRSAVKLAQAIKQVDPRVVTVLGGPHPSALPELAVSYPDVDLVISGEGELPLSELLDGRPYDRIPGLTWLDDGLVRSNPRPPALPDLDALPLPDFEGLPVEQYRHIYLPKGVTLPVLSGRGCPYQCVFCASSVVTQRQCRFLSPSRFVDNIDNLANRYGIRNFDFVDETFVLKKSRVREICGEILGRGLRINWVCQTRVNGLDLDTVRLMKRAGCRIMQVGIESGDQGILDLIGKGIQKESVHESCRIIKRAGLRLTGFFVLGLPYDTPESIGRTIEFARGLPLDIAQFSMFAPLPGSAGWELGLDGEVLKMYADNWDDFSRYTYPIVESDALSREQLKILHGTALRRFYYRPRMVLKHLLSATSPQKLRSLIDKTFAYLQIVGAKRAPRSAPRMPQVRRDGLERLIGPLEPVRPHGEIRSASIESLAVRARTDGEPCKTPPGSDACSTATLGCDP